MKKIISTILTMIFLVGISQLIVYGTGDISVDNFEEACSEYAAAIYEEMDCMYIYPYKGSPYYGKTIKDDEIKSLPYISQLLLPNFRNIRIDINSEEFKQIVQKAEIDTGMYTVTDIYKRDELENAITEKLGTDFLFLLNSSDVQYMDDDYVIVFIGGRGETSPGSTYIIDSVKKLNETAIYCEWHIENLYTNEISEKIYNILDYSENFGSRIIIPEYLSMYPPSDELLNSYSLIKNINDTDNIKYYDRSECLWLPDYGAYNNIACSDVLEPNDMCLYLKRGFLILSYDYNDKVKLTEDVNAYIDLLKQIGFSITNNNSEKYELSKDGNYVVIEIKDEMISINTYPGISPEEAYWQLREAYIQNGISLDILDYKNFIFSENEKITVTLNGKNIEFDQPPIIKDDRTLVPLRAIFEALGATVEWYRDTKTVTAIKDNITVTLTIGDYYFYKNGQKIEIDVPGMIVNDRTLVPVRAISEAFDCDVAWDGDAKQVIIRSNIIYNNTNLVQLFNYTCGDINEGEFDKNVDINGVSYHVSSEQIYNGRDYDYDKFRFKINGSVLNYDAGFFIRDAYLADLNTNDDCVELIISTGSENGVNTIDIFQYNEGTLKQLKFSNTRVMDEKNNLTLFAGANYNGIIMNEDNSITLTAKSNSYAMWGIRKTLRLNSNNVIIQDLQEKYDVDIEEFMGDKLYHSYDDLIEYGYISSEAEYDMLQQGYALCKQSYDILKKGDYFTILYDDDNGNIYIKTMSGTEGWINIKSLKVSEREKISKLMFYLAG